jgi:hypothetical protein
VLRRYVEHGERVPYEKRLEVQRALASDATPAAKGRYHWGRGASKARIPMRFALVATFFLIACDRSPTAATPLVLTASAGNGQTVAVGYPVPISPSVTVTSDSRPVAGVAVTFTFPPRFGVFTVGAGGSVIVKDTVVISDAAGIARVGSWYLSTSVGIDSLTASAVGAAPIIFTATATPGAAFGYAKWAGDGQTALAGSSLSTMPAIRVIDQFGNGVPGVSAMFTVMSGGGSVAGATLVTGPNGVATLGAWTLGSAPGANTLRVLIQANGGPGVPFTFTATGVASSAAQRGLR